MRAKTLVISVAAVLVGFLILTAPQIVGFTVILLGACALWRIRPRAGRAR